MRLGLVLPVILAGAGAMAAPAQAQNYPWCSNFHDGAGVNCGFTSYEQCAETARGSGGFCTPNNTYKSLAAAAPAHYARRGPRAKK